MHLKWKSRRPVFKTSSRRLPGNAFKTSLRLLKEVLKTSSGRRLDDVLKKVVTASISDQSETSLRPKLRRFYDVFMTSLCRLGYRFKYCVSSVAIKCFNDQCPSYLNAIFDVATEINSQL